MKKSTALKEVILTALFVAAIYLAGQALATITLAHLTGVIRESSFAQKNFVFKIYLLLFTLLAMVALQKTRPLAYGFGTGQPQSYLFYLKKGVVFALLGLFSVIVCSIIGFVITRQKPVSFPPERLLDRVLFIWIWSSVVEEILFRGLVQSYLSNIKGRVFTLGKAAISPAVFFSALFFACLHLGLLWQGFSPFVVIGIFINTLILGLVASYYREKSGSIWPAIFIHVVFNIVGSLPLLLAK